MRTMGLPIFFIHKYNSSYLKYALLQAKKDNSNSTIYLLGDKTNNKYDFVEHHLLYDYLSDEFSKHYVHMSTNSFNFELFCFERWFILKNFIESNKITCDFMYLDSDVMIYCDLTEESRKWTKYKLTVCNENGPQYTYFKSIDVLSDFCRMIIESYSIPNKFKEIESVYKNYIESSDYHGGGICDMTLLNRFSVTLGNEVLDLEKPDTTGAIFDDNINEQKNYIFSKKYRIKSITFIDGEPHITEHPSNRAVRLKAAHFQGKAKPFMKIYYTGDVTLKLKYYYYIDTFRTIFGTVISQLRASLSVIRRNLDL